MANPWEMNWGQPQAPASGGLEAVPLPDRNPPTTWRTLSPTEAKSMGYGDGGTYQVSSAGEVKQSVAPPKGAGGAADVNPETRGQAKAKIAAARQMRAQLQEVERLFDQQLAGGRSPTEFLPTPGNSEFDAAVDGLMPLARQAFRVPGSGADSDRESKYIQNILPNRFSFDEKNKQRITQLYEMIDAVEREYGPIAGEDAAKPAAPPAQAVDAPEQQLEAAPPQLAPSAGETRSVIDPKAQKIAGRIGSMIAQGADRNKIMGFAVGADPSLRNDPKFRAAIDEALKFRGGPNWQQWQRLNPGKAYPFDPAFYTREQPLSAVESGLSQAAQSAPGAYLARAGDAVTAGNLDRIAGLTGADPEGARLALQFAGRDNPGASLAGDVSGGVLAALLGEAGLARLGVAPGLLRGVTADATYGGVTNASNATDGGFLGNFAEGALLGGGGSLGGQGVMRGVGAAARGVTAPSVRYVEGLDVPLTVGQAVGQSGRLGAMVKGVEDRLSGLPVVGDAVNARRLEGLAKMNSKAFDKALEPIKENVAGQYGEDAVAAAQEKVGEAFRRALGGKTASLDRRFIVEAEKAKMAIEKLPDRVSAEVDNQINEVIGNYFDDAGNLSGENMQALLRELDGVKRAYRNDPLGHRIGKTVDLFSDTVENLFRRQAPDVMPQYDAAKKAFKRLSTVEDAVLRAKNTGGIFTPGQLGMSDRAQTVKFGGKHKAAAGGGEFHEFQRNMQEVLPNKVPDSGTAGRLMLPLAAMGAGAGAESFGGVEGGTATGLTLGALLSLAYSRAAQRALVGGASRRGPVAQKIGQKAKGAARISGAATGAALSGPRD